MFSVLYKRDRKPNAVERVDEISSDCRIGPRDFYD